MADRSIKASRGTVWLMIWIHKRSFWDLFTVLRQYLPPRLSGRWVEMYFYSVEEDGGFSWWDTSSYFWVDLAFLLFLSGASTFRSVSKGPSSLFFETNYWKLNPLLSKLDDYEEWLSLTISFSFYSSMSYSTDIVDLLTTFSPTGSLTIEWWTIGSRWCVFDVGPGIWRREILHKSKNK